ncbi:MAG: 5-formyltetrahydrofolate cyclo-ligase [Paenisporosarcina sp.]
MEKSQLRKKTLHILNRMDQQAYNERSSKIVDFLFEEIKFSHGDIVGITLSSFPEVDTWLLIEKLWYSGIRVAAPKCDSKERSMQFYEISSFDQLEIVYMKLHEPNPNQTNKGKIENISYLIVPGVVFDSHGYRIGFGGGYYDRFLSGYEGPTISLAFDEQIIQAVPKENFDIPVQLIITDKRIIKCNGTR